mgnify:CR=1 FL=1
MAKVLFSGIAGVDLRNKLNGSVFSKNRYGAYVRTKVTPVNPQSTAQQLVRNRLSTQSQAWRGLTEPERQSWIDGAVNFPFTDIYGNTKILSGQALYVKLNTNLAQAGIAANSVCPSPVSLDALVLTSLTADAGGPTLELTTLSGMIQANQTLVVQSSGNVTPGKMFVKNLFRFIGIYTAATPFPIDLYADNLAVHGVLVTDNKIFIRAFFVSNDTGQVGIPVQIMAIIT